MSMILLPCMMREAIKNYVEHLHASHHVWNNIVEHHPVCTSSSTTGTRYQVLVPYPRHHTNTCWYHTVYAYALIRLFIFLLLYLLVLYVLYCTYMSSIIVAWSISSLCMNMYYSYRNWLFIIPRSLFLIPHTLPKGDPFQYS